ncbi:phenazine biosynthesis protein PhzF family protein [Trichomonas vaginalis G3]|uniref:Phenazine biosynthesis protein PhzF family protein n=1 Tax=Trichomonas vaginalis (strain ATCC PRA-98 / G3) TaxID=412133 RepID=A2FEZ9_TRIV3|nr:negative regulation of SMAD protein signal transduction [Trichomonas vaginalis G3]EAX96503.1 phenazine biosynthesis protein PhzF family protein [Trichomonas vaginalis G3]KAI5506506.1 negative regulation of SMAD protein signal transduction [Trichomonas vaginalis G3]|eukprot:XP_001309433.1 phenazine biosynthesis protein PhzF family protein [Trichomonas vaginalis G3]
MDKWLDDQIMQSIAIENNLSETAFTVREGDHYRLRWFTPGGEIDLCGHATLATSYVIFRFYEKTISEVTFHTKGGILTVKKQGNLLQMNFPAYKLQKVEVTKEMEDAIGHKPLEAYISRDLVCVLENEEQVKNSHPDSQKMMKLDGLLLHITSKGHSDIDCVTRSFAPKLKVYEDPVCGSGHCHVIPYWSEKLGKNQLKAFQASPRTGTLYCEIDGERVNMSGEAVLYSINVINFA